MLLFLREGRFRLLGCEGDEALLVSDLVGWIRVRTAIRNRAQVNLGHEGKSGTFTVNLRWGVNIFVVCWRWSCIVA